MTWRLIIIAVLIVLLIPTMALLRKQEAVKKTGDKEQIAAVQKQLNVFCGLLIALFVCVLAVTMFGCHDVQCVFCEILEKNKSFLQKTLDNSRLDWYTK